MIASMTCKKKQPSIQSALAPPAAGDFRLGNLSSCCSGMRSDLADLQTHNGITPLHLAILEGFDDIASILMSVGQLMPPLSRILNFISQDEHGTSIEFTRQLAHCDTLMSCRRGSSHRGHGWRVAHEHGDSPPEGDHFS